MKAAIIINEIRLFSREGAINRKIRLRSGVNIIEGPFGAGKSSLLELIKFGLGGDGILTRAVKIGLSRVEVDVQVRESLYTLKRNIGRNRVEVRDSESGDSIKYAAEQGQGGPDSISDFWLRSLGIPQLDVSLSKSKLGTTSSPLSFFDIFKYLYLCQSEIDRSVMSHHDSREDARRRVTFEVLYGLTSARIESMEIERGRFIDRKSTIRRDLQAVDAYLKSMEVDSKADLNLRRAIANAKLGDVAEQLAEVRSGARTATDFEEVERTRLRHLYFSLRQEEGNLEELKAKVISGRRLVAQLELNLERLFKSDEALSEMSSYDFQKCPSCLRKLSASRARDGQCSVCLQREPPQGQEYDLDREAERVRRQIRETNELIRSDLEEVERSQKRTAAVRANIRESEADLEKRAAEYISPQLELVQTLVRRIADLDGQIKLIDRDIGLWQRYGQLYDEIADLDSKVNALEEELGRERLSLRKARKNVEELSDIFSEIIKKLNNPDYRSGYINPRSYLPIVNNHKFEDLAAGSGGVLTLVNVAYHLAGLVFALRNNDSIVPRFLMIDSPRKGWGRHKENVGSIQSLFEFYEYLEYTQTGKFQLIVAENDVPKGHRKKITLALGYEDKLVKGFDDIPDSDPSDNGQLYLDI